ncbi:hypothetical protein EV688_11431 [Chromatocurvus halotolerans]|uniref:Uncharacterized protein n=1 Tax=Chromatocurvus halotolerans TaxID=1132028 RepID=A0A4R2KVR0_9GAMM|nr:hypothetical protein EV688_11431 [Chromatocurvus halotolerans]
MMHHELHSFCVIALAHRSQDNIDARYRMIMTEIKARLKFILNTGQPAPIYISRDHIRCRGDFGPRFLLYIA